MKGLPICSACFIITSSADIGFSVVEGIGGFVLTIGGEP